MTINRNNLIDYWISDDLRNDPTLYRRTKIYVGMLYFSLVSYLIAGVVFASFGHIGIFNPIVIFGTASLVSFLLMKTRGGFLVSFTYHETVSVSSLGS